MKTALRAMLLVAGLGLFAWFVHRAGPGEIWTTCTRLGWLAPLALAPYAVVYAADTLGWHFAFGTRGHSLSFWRLYLVRWCGEAVNNVAPTAYVGGEAVKVALLAKMGVATRDATASVIVGRTVQTLTQVLFVALGAGAFWHLAQPGTGVRQAMLFVLVGSALAVVILFWLQTHGVFTLLLSGLRRLRIRLPQLEARREKLEEVDRQVLQFYSGQRGHFFLSAAAYFGGWLLDTLDIVVVSWLLGMPVTWPQALAVEASIGVAKVIGLFVPGALGVQESGIAVACRLAGLPDALGLSYAIIRRGREVIYASIGWLCLYREAISVKTLLGSVDSDSARKV